MVFLFLICLLVEGSGSWRPKNLRTLRIWNRNTGKNDADSWESNPQHCFNCKALSVTFLPLTLFYKRFFFLFCNQCCGSGMFIPDPTFFHPGSSSSKNLRILTPKKPKKWFLSSKKYDPVCSSRIPDPDADFLHIPYPRSRIQGSKRHPIPDPDLNTVCKVNFSINFHLSHRQVSSESVGRGGLCPRRGG